MSMLLFLDEAGDTGFKFTQSSSKFFVIGLVIFEDKEEASVCDQGIGLLRRQLGLKDNYEFHFKKDSDRIRKAFIQKISSYDFYYYGIVIDKMKLLSKNNDTKVLFYRYTCSLVFENAKDKLNNAIVIIDRQGGKKFEKELQTYLKRKMNKSLIKKVKKVKMDDSHRNNLLQIADYIASGLYRRLSKPNDHSINLLKDKEVSVKIRPKEKFTPIHKESTS